MNIGFALTLAVAPMVTLASCAPAKENAEAKQNPTELNGACDASSLGYAVGKTLTTELEAKLKSEAKASLVRVAAHDGAITMDFSPARLNIFIDNVRKIIRIDCG